jgi:hypothetical protein
VLYADMEVIGSWSWACPYCDYTPTRTTLIILEDLVEDHLVAAHDYETWGVYILGE